MTFLFSRSRVLINTKYIVTKIFRVCSYLSESKHKITREKRNCDVDKRLPPYYVNATFHLFTVALAISSISANETLRPIHTERKRKRKQKNSLMFVVYSLIFFACRFIFSLSSDVNRPLEGSTKVPRNSFTSYGTLSQTVSLIVF